MRGKRKSEEVKRFIAMKKLQPLVSSFATSLVGILQQCTCVMAMYASDARWQEKSYVTFCQAQLRSIPDLWIEIHSACPSQILTHFCLRLLVTLCSKTFWCKS